VETIMSQTTLYQYIKLGMHLEFLRGIASVSIIPGTSLVAWPSLMDNQPATRNCVMKVVEAIKAVQLQLGAMGLTQTLDQAHASWDPMLAQMQAALDGSPQPAAVILRDDFANQLIDQTKIVVQALKEETASRAA
jgi:hypothetical protein